MRVVGTFDLIDGGDEAAERLKRRLEGVMDRFPDSGWSRVRVQAQDALPESVLDAIMHAHEWALAGRADLAREQLRKALEAIPEGEARTHDDEGRRLLGPGEAVATGIVGGVALRVHLIGDVHGGRSEVGLLEPIELSVDGDVLQARFYPGETAEKADGFGLVTWPRFRSWRLNE